MLQTAVLKTFLHIFLDLMQLDSLYQLRFHIHIYKYALTALNAF